MAEHRTPGLAGGAGGVENRRSVAGRDRRGRPTVWAAAAEAVPTEQQLVLLPGDAVVPGQQHGCQPFAGGEAVEQAAHDHASEAARPQHAGAAAEQAGDIKRDQNLDTGIVELRGKLEFGEQAAEMNDGRTAAKCGQKRNDIVGRVGQEQPDPAARADAVQPHAARDLANLLRHLAIGLHPAEEVEERMVGPSPGSLVEQIADRARGKRRIPRESPRIFTRRAPHRRHRLVHGSASRSDGSE